MVAITDEEWGKWFEGVWASREEKFYPKFFGKKHTKIFNLTKEIFTEYFGLNDCDPAWLSNIVIEYPPIEGRETWLYVTSGMSNPIGQEPASIKPDELSGLGFELIIETPERAHWPIKVLHRVMAYQLLVATQHIEGMLMEYDLIIPLEEPVSQNSEIKNFIALLPEEGRVYPNEFHLSSGIVEFMVLFGATDKELENMPENQESDMIERYAAQTEYPVTNAFRKSVK